LKDISDLLDYIFDDLKEKDKKIIPYEEGRYTISNGFKLSNDFNDPQKGIQVIQTLLECGYPICLGSVYLKDKEKWYTVFKLIYNYYPFPVLFFSLQYSDENLIKRMGQDFAFSDGLKDDIIQILPMLLKAFLTPQTPQNIRKSILNFSSELFISLEPKYWESLFYRIWKKNEFIKKAYAKRPCEEQNFVEKAIPFIKSKVIIEDIINNSLKHIDSNISTNYLNQIARNKKLEKELKINQSLTLANNIHKLILSLSISENAWFILGNIDSIISKSQIKLIQKQIFKLNLNNLKDERIWHVLLYYSKNNKILVDLIKKSIITNKSLWNSGFTQDGLSSGYFHIKLSTLVKNKNHQNGIIWTKSEVIEIFKRLVIEILKIENWLKKDRGSNKNFSFILEEMMFFLNAEKTKIKEISESSSIIKKVYDLYLDSKGYKNLVDGILSKENTKVIWALSELSNKIYISNWLKDSDIKQEVDALLNKILLQSEPSLEASISYLAAFVRDKSNMELFQPKSTILVMILKKYLENPLEEFDKPFVYEKLIIIANNLKKWHFRSVYIDKWLSIQQNTHFNNIKFNINV
jgi:hypothetical protein